MKTPTQRDILLLEERNACMQTITTATKKLIHAQQSALLHIVSEDELTGYFRDSIFHSETIAYHSQKIKKINIDLELIHQAQLAQNRYINRDDTGRYTERDHEWYLNEVSRLIEARQPRQCVALELIHFAGCVVNETRNLTKLPL